jgi:hypothetical protein
VVAEPLTVSSGRGYVFIAMSTGGAKFYYTKLENGRCPHCERESRFERIGDAAFDASVPHQRQDPEQPERSFGVFAYRCVLCSRPVVWLERHTCEADRELLRVYPLRSEHPPAPAGAPAPLRSAYDEACRVLPVSANAAAALARRGLQLTLRSLLPASQHGDLNNEINHARPHLTDRLTAGLHGLRVIGNFAAHPNAELTSGLIIETAHDEAEATLSLFFELLHHLFEAGLAADRVKTAADSKIARKKT